MPKARKSFEASRKELQVTLSRGCGGKPVDVVIRFDNDDVPNFLKKLDEFEAASRKSRLVIA
jgi:hypothetical protein